MEISIILYNYKVQYVLYQRPVFYNQAIRLERDVRMVDYDSFEEFRAGLAFTA